MDKEHTPEEKELNEYYRKKGEADKHLTEKEQDDKSFKEAQEDMKRKNEEKKQKEQLKEDIWCVNEDGKKKLSHLDLAKGLVKEFKIVTIGNKRPDSYYFDGKIIQEGGKALISKQCQEITEGKIKVNDVNEVIGHIERITWKDRDIFNNAPLNLIPFENGVYDRTTEKLLPHSFDYHFTFLIPHNYNPKADCPKIKKFLLDVLGSEDEVKLAEEFIGYCLYRRYSIKKAWIIKGDQDTGKTTLLNLVNLFIGQKNTSGVSLHRIIYDKFSASRLYGKMLNFYDDLPIQDIKDTGAFKIATGGGFISAEKKFGDSFEFQNHAKFLFAANYFVVLADKINVDDMAYYGRYLITLCENVFDNKTRDRNILDKLTTPEEMSGLINIALEGLKRLLTNGSFTYSRTPEENKILMEKNSSSIVGFIQDGVMQEDEKWIATSDLYEAYCYYCSENMIPKESPDKFSKVFCKKAVYVLPKQRNATIKGKLKKNVRGYINVAFNNKYNTFSNIILYKKESNSVFTKYDTKEDVIDVSNSDNS